MDLTYVLPIRCHERHASCTELPDYLSGLAAHLEVVVVDNSGPDAFAEHARSFGDRVRHLRPLEAMRTANGKVANVLTGIAEATSDRIVLADDDVRHTPETLRAIADRLEDADVVVPTNVFRPMPWHARWDTARTLLNRSLWIDYPGTLGVRRSAMTATGGYDGDVLFENLELLRTVRAAGGRVLPAPDVYVTRRPPTLGAFLGQRVRQAYDDLAQPAKLAVVASLLPVATWAAARRRTRVLGAAGVAAVALAEIGRRRDAGAEVFPASASLLAPLWLAERAVCAWIAIARRLALGGIRYGGRRIRTAATPERVLRGRLAQRGSRGDAGRERAAA